MIKKPIHLSAVPFQHYFTVRSSLPSALGKPISPNRLNQWWLLHPLEQAGGNLLLPCFVYSYPVFFSIFSLFVLTNPFTSTLSVNTINWLLPPFSSSLTAKLNPTLIPKSAVNYFHTAPTFPWLSLLLPWIPAISNTLELQLRLYWFFITNFHKTFTDYLHQSFCKLCCKHHK